MKALGEKRKRGRALPRRLGFCALDSAEMLLQFAGKGMQVVADKTFDQKDAAWAEQFKCHRERGAIERQAARHIGIANTAQLRRQIGQYAGRRTAEHLSYLPPNLF